MSSAKDILESVSALLAFITSHLSSWNLNLTISGQILLYPRSTEGGMGVYWIHPDVCLSVRLKTTRFPELFEKTIGSIHFIPVIYPYGVSLLTPIHFRVPSLIYGPLVAKYLAKNGVSGNFLKNCWPNSLHSWHLPLWMGWVSWPLYIFVFLASFTALWWPNIWPKMGFPELFEKTISSIHFIPGFLTPIHFCVPSLIFLKNSHLCSTWLQNRNLYWIFLDEVGSDQSGGILSPFMGTACLDFFHPIYDKFQLHLVKFQGNFEFLLCDFLAATK